MALTCRLAVSLFLFVGILWKESTAIQYTPEVTIKNSGKIRGIVEKLNTGGTVRKYIGIPFAQAKRFENPTDPEPWSDVKNVTTFGKMCPQPGRTLADMSEDCLNLNVFVPVGAGSSLPVMVWIHGGAFISGSNRIYDSKYIASLGEVIVVVINYRLNLFGFLATTKDGDLPGNYGMLDQVQALKWVKSNIKTFGGDPNKVTIFGESAGGASVNHLVLSPMAKDLFHNAILQSGDSSAMWAYQTHSESSAMAKNLGKNNGCDDIKTLAACMKKKSLKEILGIVAKSAGFGWYFPPVVGGSFLPADSPEALLAKEKINVKVMIGCNNDEGSVATNAVRGIGSGFNITNGYQRLLYKTLLLGGRMKLVRGQNKVINEAILYRYTDWNNVTDRYRTRRMLLDMNGDAMFVAPAIKTAKALAAKSVATYMYHLQYRFAVSYALGIQVLPSWLGAYHGADLPILFGQPLVQASVTNSSVYTKDANFTRAMIKMWTNFAKTGNPNTPADIGLVWPQYDLLQQQYMALKPNMAVQAKLRNDHVAFWNSFVPAAIKAMPKPSPTPTHPPGSSGTGTMSGLIPLVLSVIFTLYLV